MGIYNNVGEVVGGDGGPAVRYAGVMSDMVDILGNLASIMVDILGNLASIMVDILGNLASIMVDILGRSAR